MAGKRAVKTGLPPTGHRLSSAPYCRCDLGGIAVDIKRAIGRKLNVGRSATLVDLNVHPRTAGGLGALPNARPRPALRG
jgi:hypothetical protein